MCEYKCRFLLGQQAQIQLYNIYMVARHVRCRNMAIVTGNLRIAHVFWKRFDSVRIKVSVTIVYKYQ